MRLTEKQFFSIKETFKECFSFGDMLWLFGSRVDDSKKGGDIDLYVETDCGDGSAVFKKKLKFIGDLQRKIGEQKIDVVIKMSSDTNDLLIYKEAQRTGVLLMKKQTLLAAYIENLDVHAARLEAALDEVVKFIPVNSIKMASLEYSEVGTLEILNSRFSKIQDDIGAKVFPLVLELSDKKAVTYLDKLNAIEKLGLLDDAKWWVDLRDLRNEITHEYQNDYEMLSKHTNDLVPLAQELLDYWKQLKPKLEPFVREQEREQKLGIKT